MAENQGGFGLFGKYGLPGVSRKSYEAEVTAMAPQLALARSNIPADAPLSTRLAAGAGAALAGAGGVQMDEQTAARFKVVEGVNESMRRMQQESPELWDAMDEDQKANYFQTQLIKNANAAGLYDVGAQAAADLGQRRANKVLEQLEMERLRSGNKKTDAERANLELQNLISKRQFELGKPGDQNTYWDPVTGKPVNGTAMTGGTVKANGEERTDLILLDDWVDLMSAGQGRGGSGDSAFKIWNTLMPDGRRKVAYETFNAVQQQHGISNRIIDMMNNALDDGRLPETFMDGSGKFVSFLGNVVGTARGLLGAAYDLNGEKETLRTLIERESGADLESFIQIPPGLKEAGIDAAEYQSMIVDLAYSIARANEPGARQLSDTDFRNSLKVIGAAAADPKKLLKVMMANYGRSGENLGRIEGLIQGTVNAANNFGTGKMVGYEDAYGMVFGNDYFESVDREAKLRTKMDALFERMDNMGSNPSDLAQTDAGDGFTITEIGGVRPDNSDQGF